MPFFFSSCAGLDILAAVVFLALLAGESVADYQMLTFQSEKYKRIVERAPL